MTPATTPAITPAPTAWLVPDDAELFAVATQAAEAGMLIIGNGTRFAISPIVPAGWHAVPVGDKQGGLRP